MRQLKFVLIGLALGALIQAMAPVAASAQPPTSLSNDDAIQKNYEAALKSGDVSKQWQLEQEWGAVHNNVEDAAPSAPRIDQKILVAKDRLFTVNLQTDKVLGARQVCELLHKKKGKIIRRETEVPFESGRCETSSLDPQTGESVIAHPHWVAKRKTRSEAPSDAQKHCQDLASHRLQAFLSASAGPAAAANNLLFKTHAQIKVILEDNSEGRILEERLLKGYDSAEPEDSFTLRPFLGSDGFCDLPTFSEIQDEFDAWRSRHIGEKISDSSGLKALPSPETSGFVSGESKKSKLTAVVAQ